MMNLNPEWAVRILDAVGTWITLVALFALAWFLLRNQQRGFAHLNRLHKAVLHLESELKKPQPRYLLEPTEQERENAQRHA
ncbi:MAG TPA: hypothetical protein VEQ62_16165 [Stellaceae bacterium]|jgi:hypothetical protein|nr:hypothetical protein [Stellaceae bacterium]